jgi:hypothetical protein
MVEVDGVQITGHAGKTAALTQYFGSIIGHRGTSSWSFDVNDLFVNCPKTLKPNCRIH